VIVTGSHARLGVFAKQNHIVSTALRR